MEARAVPAGGLRAVPGPVVRIDEARNQPHLDEVVSLTVVGTLNALLDAEAEQSVRRPELRAGGRAQIHAVG